MHATNITTSDQTRALADGLLDTQRELPWGVVTVPEHADQPLIDLEHLHDQVGDVCRIHTIKTGALTRELEARLPERCQVYGGASRIYPTGERWQTDPEQSPLRFVHNPNQSNKVTEQLIHDALGMAAQAGLFAKPAPSSVPARGTVQKLLAENTRALIALENGQYATIVHEFTYPNVPLEWIIQEGQQVEGFLDPQTKRLAPTLTPEGPIDLLQHFPDGAVTLAYVVDVDRQNATLAVHPAHAQVVAKRHITSNPHDRVDLLLAPGDVVPVRLYRDEQGRPALRLNDIDDEEPASPSLILTPGGLPWLAQDRHQPDTEDDAEFVPSAAAETSSVEPHVEIASIGATEVEAPDQVLDIAKPPKPAPGTHRVIPTSVHVHQPGAATQAATATKGTSALQTTQLSLDAARSEIIRLKTQLARDTRHGHSADTTALELSEATARNRRITRELREARTEQRTQRTMLRKLSKQAEKNSYTGRRERFDDDNEWMRHEVHLAWIQRQTPDDRREHPLPDDYRIGSEFVASLDGFDDPTKDKALKAVVDVLTGRARDMPARAVHALRSAESGNASDFVRDDGARCMRAYIEHNVAAARRLHFWVHPNGVIELSRIVTHDDMEP